MTIKLPTLNIQFKSKFSVVSQMFMQQITLTNSLCRSLGHYIQLCKYIQSYILHCVLRPLRFFLERSRKCNIKAFYWIQSPMLETRTKGLFVELYLKSFIRYIDTNKHKNYYLVAEWNCKLQRKSNRLEAVSMSRYRAVRKECSWRFRVGGSGRLDAAASVCAELYSFKNQPSKTCSDLLRSREQKSMLEARSSAWPISSSLQAFSVLFKCKLELLLSLCVILSKLKTLLQRLVL